MEDIDIPTAVAVQDHETELKVFRDALQAHDPSTHGERWARFARLLWNTTFLMIFPGTRKSARVPDGLGVELARLDPWTAAVTVVARARATVSGQDGRAEAVSVEQNARRYLGTREGKARQAYLDEHRHRNAHWKP